MSRGLIIKSLIALAVLVLLYSIFWFFYAGQIEKKIHHFVKNNASHLSIGKVEVSGFPFAQKVLLQDLTFIIPNPALNKYQTLVKEVQASSGLFSTDFTLSITGQVLVQDLDGQSFGYIKFDQNPTITLSLSDSLITKFNYQDSGYQVLNENKATIYVASASKMSFQSALEDDHKVANKLTVNIQDLEGFEILDIYQNVMEKKIIDGIKTGEIAVKKPEQKEVNEVIADPVEEAVISADLTDLQETRIASVQKSQEVWSTVKEKTLETQANSIAVEEEVEEEITQPKSFTSNLAIEIEYELVPNNSTDQEGTETTHINSIPMHYSKQIKISNFKFSNEIYTISINGNMTINPDDNMPSGAVTIRVENMKNLADRMSHQFIAISNEKIPEVAVRTSTLQPATDDIIEATPDNPEEIQSIKKQTVTIVEKDKDPYHQFLQNLADSLHRISTEMAKKNQLTEGDSAVFDIRREKNIEILINETPMREILGKF